MYFPLLRPVYEVLVLHPKAINHLVHLACIGQGFSNRVQHGYSVPLLWLLVQFFFCCTDAIMFLGFWALPHTRAGAHMFVHYCLVFESAWILFTFNKKHLNTVHIETITWELFVFHTKSLEHCSIENNWLYRAFAGAHWLTGCRGPLMPWAQLLPQFLQQSDHHLDHHN